MWENAQNYLKLIRAGKLDDFFIAFESDEELLGDQLANQYLTELSGKYRQLEKQFHGGLISNADYQVELSKIRKAAIEFFSPPKKDSPKGTNNAIPSMRWVWGIAVAVVVLVIVLGIPESRDYLLENIFMTPVSGRMEQKENTNSDTTDIPREDKFIEKKKEEDKPPVDANNSEEREVPKPSDNNNESNDTDLGSKQIKEEEYSILSDLKLVMVLSNDSIVKLEGNALLKVEEIKVEILPGGQEKQILKINFMTAEKLKLKSVRLKLPDSLSGQLPSTC